AFEAAAGPWVGPIRVVPFGVGEGLEELETVALYDDIACLLVELQTQRAETADLLAQLSIESVVDARLTNAVGDAWIPTLVLVAESIDKSELERLAELAEAPSTITVIAMDARSASHRWHITR